jgi:hypothetical protein
VPDHAPELQLVREWLDSWSGIGLELATLLAMPLADFALDGQPIEIRVLWWPETLFFVPRYTDVVHLERDGIGRHRIWTAGELRMLLEIQGWTTRDLEILTVARREFRGDVVDVWSPDRHRPP